jgi:glycosyltransferase involved in cell wall biosynthesis
MSVPQILTKWSSQITGAICLTEWHQAHISNEFHALKDKISIINNGIVPSFLKGDGTEQKIKNSFVYTSCSERGLKKLLEVWPEILKTYPDATLKISSYNKFPQNDYDVPLKKIVDAHPSSITHLGALKPDQLYELMRSSEYWLYTSYWPETSCITALEMLASGVICIYYPIAGLTNTMDKCGIQIKEGEEMSTLNQINNWSKEEKDAIIASGKQYVFNSCSWEHRAASWTRLIFPTNNQ